MKNKNLQQTEGRKVDNLIISIVTLFLVGLGLAMIIGQRRGARAYTRFIGAAVRNIGSVLYNLATWVFTRLGYGVEDTANHFPATTGVIITLLVVALIYFIKHDCF